MDNIFEVIDKTGRKIRMTNNRWKHIKKHPHMDENILEDIKQIVKNPSIVRYQKVLVFYLGLKSEVCLGLLDAQDSSRTEVRGFQES